MGIGSKEKVNDSVKDDKQFLDKEKDNNKFNEISKRDEINDSKDDKRKNYDKDNKLIQETQEEKKASKWGKIDWNKDTSEERKASKWDRIDWNKENSEEKKESKWDKIDWNKDISDERNESNSNNEYSENEKIEGYINDNLKDNMMFGEGDDKKIKGLKDFDEDFEAKEKDEVFLEEKKDNLENKYVGENCVEEFKKETNEEGVEVDLLKGKKQKLEERENDLDNLNDLRKNKEEMEIEDEKFKFNERDNKLTDFEENHDNEQDYRELKTPKYYNLMDEKVQEKFRDYYKNTGKYPNWGSKIKKDFWKSIDYEKKYLKKELATNKLLDNYEKKFIKHQILSLDQILLKCKSIDGKHEILEVIIDKLDNTDLSHQKISALLNNYGVNVSRNTIKNISISRLEEKLFLRIKKEYKWNFLDVDKKGQTLVYEKKLEKAAKYLNDEILTDGFRRKNSLGPLQTPKQSLLKKEHCDFISALYHRKISLNDVLKKAGYRINMERNKWTFLEYDENGILLSYERQVQRAGEYLKSNILTKDYKIAYNLEMNKAPTVEILSKAYSDYFSALHIRKISYNDVIESAGLIVNYQIGKWKFLDFDDKGNLLSHIEQLQKATEYLTNKVLTETFKDVNNLAESQAPTVEMLQKDHLDYVGAIKKRHLSYNDILEKAGLNPNCEFGKWGFLDYNENRIQLSYSEQVEGASNYLKSKILTPDYITRNKLGIKETPSVSMLRNEHGDFCSAIIRRKIFYNDIIEKAGYQPHDIQDSLEIGRNIHIIKERILLEHTRYNNCKSFYEPFPSINTKKTQLENLYGNYKLNHCDNGIILDDNFRNLSKEIKNLCNERKDIKMVNIDYYLGNSEQKSREKCLKGYQGKGKMVILVPTHANKPQPLPKNIPYSKNVKILDPLSFADFIGYNGKLRQEFINCVELAKNATWDDDSREKLKKLANHSKGIIKKYYNFGQKELEEYIKSTPNLSMNLLKYIPDNSVLDKWIYKKK